MPQSCDVSWRMRCNVSWRMRCGWSGVDERTTITQITITAVAIQSQRHVITPSTKHFPSILMEFVADLVLHFLQSILESTYVLIYFVHKTTITDHQLLSLMSLKYSFLLDHLSFINIPFIFVTLRIIAPLE
jgi:hypothetical protein